jgi:hypothetical protein
MSQGKSHLICPISENRARRDRPGSQGRKCWVLAKRHLPVKDILGQDSWLTGGFLREVKAAEEEWKHYAANTRT